MEKGYTFASVVRRDFLEDIEKVVSRHVDETYRRMEFKSWRVKRVDEAFVQGQRLARAIAYDTFSNTMSFDAVIVADIAIFQTSHSQQIEDDEVKWFRVSCEVDVGDGFNNLRINSITDYDHLENDKKKMLDNSLVPFIHAVDLEKHATAILKHVYPEALKEPMKVDVRVFAERLGLRIEERRLSRHGTIFGQIIFHDTVVEYFDLDKRRLNSFEATGGTIFADPEIYFLRTLGSWNNTVVHECVHWLKHKKHIALERAFNSTVSRISCQVDESSLDEEKRADAHWMEWHANALAPRILMPRKPFKQKADELIAWYRGYFNTEKTTPEVVFAVIQELADFFEVSLQSAKIRMIDIGYKEAIGVLEFVDGQYVTSHSYTDGALKKDQTFSIPMKEGVFQYAFNAEFRALIDTGKFVYIDSHYCINDPKYVILNEHGILEMTEYALQHMDECCLIFKRTMRPNPEYSTQRYTKSVLYQSAVAKTLPEYSYSHSDQRKNVEELLADVKEAKEAQAIAVRLPRTFGAAVVALMEWRKITNEGLAERALVSAKTIQRLRKDKIKKHDADTIVALCVGLQLFPILSYNLLEIAGIILGYSERDYLLHSIIATRYKSTIHECNELLAAADQPPLTQQE